MIPTQILTLWFSGLLSLGIVAGGGYFVHEWYRRSWGYDAVLQQSVFAPHLGLNTPTLLLAAGVLLLFLAVAGKSVVRLMLGGNKRRNAAVRSIDPAPQQTRAGAVEGRRLRRPDGSEIQVQIYGREGAPILLLTHGWGLNSTAWFYAKRELGQRFRLILWDEPGLGLSTRPANRDYSVENLARDLRAVLDVADRQPVILLGHSIGGMIVLTFCRLFPEELGSRVAGLVLNATTYTNPVRTVKGAPFFAAIETPILKPLMYLTIGLSPLVWLMNWMSYLNGSAHLSTKRTGFAGAETWQQIDFAALFQAKASPAVLARGMLAMMHYDASATMRDINVPTLIVPGQIDPVCKPEASEYMFAAIRESRLEPLPAARHLGFLEHHEIFASYVEKFARSTNDESESMLSAADGLPVGFSAPA